MKRNHHSIWASLVLLVLTVSCEKDSHDGAQRAMPGSETPALAAPQPQAQSESAASPADGQARTGKVLETMNSGGYTYAHIDTGTEQIWVAAPECKVAVGDRVSAPGGMLMQNFESKTLGRTFEDIYFVGSLGPEGATTASPAMGMGMGMGQPQMPAGHPSVSAKTDEAAAQIDLSGIEKAEGGRTVAEVYELRKDLAGKQIAVRGKVVKFSPKIMGKNWIHLRDGSGAEGTNDLTVTSGETVAVGDTVVLSGVVTTNRDFGYGYQYSVLLEDGKLVNATK